MFLYIIYATLMNHKNLYTSQHLSLLETIASNHTAGAASATYLYNTEASAQADSATHGGNFMVFEHGTVRLRASGVYKLGENINFKPNANVSVNEDCMVLDNILDNMYPTQSQLQSEGDAEPDYPPPYNFGFFAAITIEKNNIELDLNGFNIQQSSLHYIQQRFFALIQLNPSPFIINKGPLPNWMNSTEEGSLPTPHTVWIHNSKPGIGGIIGRSSHHGILGNKNVGVLIEDVVFEQYEVAAIALNGAKNCLIRNVDIRNSQRNVPVNFLYSNAIYTRKFLKSLLTYCGDITFDVWRGMSDTTHHTGTLSVENVICNLQMQMFKVFKYVRANEDSFTFDSTDIPALFRTKNGLPEGNIYAIVMNRKGPVVADFVSDATQARTNGDLFIDSGVDASQEGNCNNIIHSVVVQNIDSFPREVIGLARKSDHKLMKGVSGNILPILEILGEDGKYHGNVATDATLMLAKCANSTSAIENFPVKPKSLLIDASIVEWAETGTTLDTIKTDFYYSNLIDQMDHYMKGNIMIFLSAANNCVIDGVQMKGIYNSGENCDCGNAERDADYAYSFAEGKNQALHFEPYRGRDINCILICGSYQVRVNLIYCNIIKSEKTKCNGIFFVGENVNVEIDNVNICETDYNSVMNMYQGARRGIDLAYDLFRQLVNSYTGPAEELPLYLNANRSVFRNLKDQMLKDIEKSYSWQKQL